MSLFRRLRLFVAVLLSAVVLSADRAEAASVQADFDGDGKTDVTVYRPDGRAVRHAILNGIHHVHGGAVGPAGRHSGGGRLRRRRQARLRNLAAECPLEQSGPAERVVHPAVHLELHELPSLLLRPGGRYSRPGRLRRRRQGRRRRLSPDRRRLACTALQPASKHAIHHVPNVSNARFSTDYPVPGDYDGDGKADLAVYRRTDGAWYLRMSSPASPR